MAKNKDIQVCYFNSNEYNQMKKLLEGCGTCSYEEADGSLLCHCKKCQFEITSLAYSMFTGL
jgi:hypothetical protein